MSEITALRCDYFDGRTTQPREVMLSVHSGQAIVSGEGVSRTDPLSSVRVSERMGEAPRLVSFPDGAFCEVRDHDKLDVLLEATGHREPLVARIQSRWTMAIGALLVCTALVAFSYLEILPWAARLASAHVPRSAIETISTQTLDLLDRHVLEPSELDPRRREELADRFRRLVPPDGETIAHRVEFRASPQIGANAFALPSGTILVTDDLVRLAGRDEEIMAVLAHELGHVHGRHGVRLILQSSVVGVVVTWYLGDVSSLIAAVPAALLQARYSRNLELEADAYAARMLRFNGMGPTLLAGMLRRLEAARGNADTATADDDPSPGGYLARHPATAERIRALEAR